MAHQARVCIGMPVYNGQRYLGAAIESILAQTFTDFNLIISDNGSTDGTEAIGRSYAAKDARITYHRLASNVGAIFNFERVYRMGGGQYYKWHAHDDVIEPAFLEK